MRYVSGTKLDERVIRCDLDPGFRDGRQYGRGKSGGQVRDEYRQEYDAGRGGWGHNRMREEEQRQKREELYQGGGHGAPQGADGEYYELEHAERAGESAPKRGADDDDVYPEDKLLRTDAPENAQESAGHL